MSLQNKLVELRATYDELTGRMPLLTHSLARSLAQPVSE